MSDVLRRVAMVHRSRLEKANKERLRAKKKLAAQQAYFKDSGIPEMWDEVKHIKIPNPIPEIVEGLSVTIADLLAPADYDNLTGTGLAVYGKHGNEFNWLVIDVSNADDEQPKLKYEYRRPNGGKGFLLDISAPEAKTKFVDSFVKWLSTIITPQMLAEMDIDFEAPSVQKRSRKILQLTET